MKLLRWGEAGAEKPGILIDDQVFDTAAFGEDYDERFFESGGLKRLRTWIERNGAGLPKVPLSVRLGPCVARPSKIICVGLNYRDHARESGMEPPKEPVIFFKSTTALCGPNDDLLIPKNSVKTDWEVELAFVISARCKNVPEKRALDYVAGYCVHNDYSEREFQLERGGQWVKGKSCDSFGPLGPYLATPEELGDPNSLRLWLSVNGKIRQDSSTSEMIFKVPFLVYYISQFMTLLPGDVISTGTPAGVGLGHKPPVYLKNGDKVELGIEGLGTQSQKAKS